MQSLESWLERFQIGIYWVAMVLGFGIGHLFVSQKILPMLMTPTLALMLFATFMQVPVLRLGRILKEGRFLCTLGAVNFVLIPGLVWVLQLLMPADPLIRFAVLFVLLTPCIDYVITFAQVGRADAHLLLAATPLLLLMQMLLLPLYLSVFLGETVIGLWSVRPFIEAFIGLIIIPLLLAAWVQFSSKRSQRMRRMARHLDLLPVPATAMVLFVVVGAMAPRLEQAVPETMRVLPIYALFAVVAPALGWWVARQARLSTRAARAVAFSAGTRNSLVILPLALAIPAAQPLLPALIVTQTLVELVASLIYMKIMPRLQMPSSFER